MLSLRFFTLLFIGLQLTIANAEKIKNKNEVLFQAIRLVDKSELSIENSLETEKIEFNFKLIEGKIQNFEHSAEGGDNVGNGGGEVTRHLLNLYNDMVSQSSQLAKLPQLNINDFKVVSGLKYKGTTYPHLVTKDTIFIDGDYFLELFKAKKDTRILILRLHLSKYKMKNPELLALKIYGELKTLANMEPYCESDISASKLDYAVFTKRFSGQESLRELEQMALNHCVMTGLKDCSLSTSGTKGFLTSSENFAEYRGHIESKRNLDDKEVRDAKCHLVKKCEQVYELAPLGQIKRSSFAALDNLIQEMCL